jgi:hypothetical protein
LNDRVRRAWATLGLQPGASPREVRTRYKALVKTWHPDRFASDPVGQAEAEGRMSQINQAYRCLLERQPRPPSTPAAKAPPPPPDPRAPPRSTGRLSRREIEALIASIGTQGPVDSLVEGLAQLWNVGRAVAVTLGLGILLLTAIGRISTGPLRLGGPVLLVVVALACAWALVKGRAGRRE